MPLPWARAWSRTSELITVYARFTAENGRS
jgi:hypothetical protein